MFRNASQLQFFFFFFFSVLKAVMNLFLFLEKFCGYELAILKILKGNALSWTWIFTCFLCTMQKTPTVSNLAIRTLVPHCLLKILHLVTLPHSCHLLVKRQRNQVCAIKWPFLSFFLLMVCFWFLIVYSINKKGSKLWWQIIAPILE